MAVSTPNKPWYKRWWAILLGLAVFLAMCFVVLVVIAIIGALLYGAARAPTTPTVPVNTSLKTSDFIGHGSPPEEGGGRGLSTSVKECGFVNALYNASNREIVMCEELAYELASTFYPTLQRHYGNDSALLNQKLNEKVYNTILFIYAHERGHALIDVYNLPITGREEDVADQIAFDYSVIAQQEAITDAATWFLLTSEDVDANYLPFFDEHSFDKQRYYNFLCWLYGTEPEKYAHVVDDGYLPKERAERCPYESYKVREGMIHLRELMYEQAETSDTA